MTVELNWIVYGLYYHVIISFIRMLEKYVDKLIN